MNLNDNDKEILTIIEQFKPKIKKSLANTSYQEREDLEQEIKLKIVEKMRTVEFKDVPGFWWMINNNNKMDN